MVEGLPQVPSPAPTSPHLAPDGTEGGGLTSAHRVILMVHFISLTVGSPSLHCNH